MKVDDVSLLEFAHACDVDTGIGDVDIKEVMSRQMGVKEHDETLPQERQLAPERLFQSHDGDVVGDFVSDKQFCLHAIVVQCFHEAVGCNRRSSCLFTCIDYKYSHCLQL